jgi:hypothetical protein
MSAAGAPHVPAPSLVEALADARPLEGTGYRDEVLRALEECRRIHALKLAPEAAGPDAPILAVVAGGTNVGKTTLLNALAGAEVARATPLARGTKAAVIWAHRARVASFLRGGFLPGYERRALSRPEEPNEDASAGALLVAGHERQDLFAVALADSPDIDSVHKGNKRVAWDLLYASDAVLFVASEEKYNDEACVAFLERAFRHGKRVLALLNKCGAPEAEEDFRRAVVPGAAARAGRPEAAARLFTVPYLPGSGAQRAERAREAAAPIAAAVAALAEDAESIRVEARRGAARALAEEAAPALERLRREAESLAHYRAEVKRLADDAARAYRAGLVALPIYEFDRVFNLLADALKVPLIDDFYARLRDAGRPVGRFFGRLVGWGGSEDGAVEKGTSERDRRDLDAARVRLGEALAGIRRLPERYPPELADALSAAMLPATEAEPLFALDAAYGESLSREAEAWVDEVLRDLHRRLAARPGAVALGRALKGTLRAVAATAAVVAFGHVGIEDLLIAPTVDLMVKLGVEKVVDRAYFAERRDEFYDRRAAVFRRLVEERAASLALARLRGGASPERIAALRRAIEEAGR